MGHAALGIDERCRHAVFECNRSRPERRGAGCEARQMRERGRGLEKAREIGERLGDPALVLRACRGPVQPEDIGRDDVLADIGRDGVDIAVTP